MKGILFISDSRESIPLVHRLRQEGVAAEIYVHSREYANNFDGILPKVPMGGLKAALKRCETVVVDITLPNHRRPNDLALLSMFGVKLNVPGVFGGIADKLMKTHQVIGSSSWTEFIELDREAGFKLAGKIGLGVPDYQKFNGLKKGIQFLESSAGKKNRWVFKLLSNGPLDLTYPETFDGELLDLMQTSIPIRLKKEKINPEQAPFILQEFVDGVEVSSELWWDGMEFLNANRTIESKKLSNDETGPGTGSQANLVWMCEDMDGVVHKEMQKLAPYLRTSGYLGCFDANCIIDEAGKGWWLEATPRCGYSALYCLCSLIPKGQLSNFFLNGFRAVFKDGYAASQLLSLYPYPNSDRKVLEMSIKDNLINEPLDYPGIYWQDIYKDGSNKLRCAGSDGMIGVITAVDEDPETAISKVLTKCQKFEVSGNKMYRSDQAATHLKRLNKLKKLSID